MTQPKLPKYMSHKIVEAVKISSIDLTEGILLHHELSDIPPIEVSVAYMRKHEPKAGGYYVRYPDGYESWSPAEAFEDGYTRIEI